MIPLMSIVWAALLAAPATTRFDGWSAACPLDIVTDPAAVPPLAWTPCPGGAAGCRLLPPGLSPTPRFSGDGALLMTTRVALDGPDPHKLWLVAPLDGPVRFAMRQSWAGGAPGCTVYEQDVAGDRFVWGVRGDGRGPLRASEADGALVGRLGVAGLSIVGRDDGPDVSSWSIGEGGLVRVVAPSGAVSLLRPGDARPVPLHPSPALPAPLRSGTVAPRPIGDSGVFEVGGGGQRHIAAWDARGRVRVLGSDRGNLGTDGADLVWTEDGAIFTAPLDTLAPRRLAPDRTTGLGASPFAVGCGVAAHWVPRASLRVVRLRDGRVADLDPPPGLAFGPALGVTCDEVVALGWTEAGPTIVRLALPFDAEARWPAPRQNAPSKRSSSSTSTVESRPAWANH